MLLSPLHTNRLDSLQFMNDQSATLARSPSASDDPGRPQQVVQVANDKQDGRSVMSLARKTSTKFAVGLCSRIYATSAAATIKDLYIRHLATFPLATTALDISLFNRFQSIGLRCRAFQRRGNIRQPSETEVVKKYSNYEV
jgi:hypothetical protein